MELDTSGFATQGPTVFAGNIGDNKYIIQVSPMGIRLLEGGRKKSPPFTRPNYKSNSAKIIIFLLTSALSDTAPLHPCGSGLSHSTLLCSRSLRGHHDSWGRGHHVCTQDRLVHGEDSPAGPTEASDLHSKCSTLTSPKSQSWGENWSYWFLHLLPHLNG